MSNPQEAAETAARAARHMLDNPSEATLTAAYAATVAAQAQGATVEQLTAAADRLRP